ncbi:hypothetical protein LTR56_000240 [Elasticomyces elasticus]|nr:hypothetical protein LTR22_022611 [Elasticomyces elasticus]KAK3661117.1 hypothetical protein LTR56_000240 [Elasticomyces elasticus]KAK4911676.1 hypothetical protein LTR49_019755 [Elasticomyces elasticus]KAK5751326.1 hypothetical protein LTS12_018642 [Elasticomyces elasticus]
MNRTLLEDLLTALRSLLGPDQGSEDDVNLLRRRGRSDGYLHHLQARKSHDAKLPGAIPAVPRMIGRSPQRSPTTRATSVGLLYFFLLNHTQWPGVLRRLADAGWRDEEVAAARLHFRGAAQEDRVERHWRQIRKQKKWAKDVESVEDYGLSSFAQRRT